MDVMKPIQGSSEPNRTLEQLAKNMQDMMVQMISLQQEQKAQNEEIKACIERLAKSQQGDNGDHHERNRNIEMEEQKPKVSMSTVVS